MNRLDSTSFPVSEIPGARYRNSAGQLTAVAPEGAWLVDSETGEVLAGVEGEADEAPSSMHYGYGAPASAKTTKCTVVISREGKIETLDEFFDRTEEVSK